jgi:hypothetical protein
VNNKVINNERIIPCDIDDTLIMHENPDQYDKLIYVEDPHHAGAMIKLGVNEPMVKVLKDEKARGAFILVWSRSGFAWANAIILALGLENSVDLIMTKPSVYLDDTEVSKWMTDRVWINPKVTYKKHI